MIEETKITARIAELEAELQAYVTQANAMVQAYQTAIGELKRLIVFKDQKDTEYVEAAVTTGN